MQLDNDRNMAQSEVESTYSSRLPKEINGSGVSYMNTHPRYFWNPFTDRLPTMKEPRTTVPQNTIPKQPKPPRRSRSSPIAAK